MPTIYDLDNTVINNIVNHAKSGNITNIKGLMFNTNATTDDLCTAGYTLAKQQENKACDLLIKHYPQTINYILRGSADSDNEAYIKELIFKRDLNPKDIKNALNEVARCANVKLAVNLVKEMKQSHDNPDNIVSKFYKSVTDFFIVDSPSSNDNDYITYYAEEATNGAVEVHKIHELLDYTMSNVANLRLLTSSLSKLSEKARELQDEKAKVAAMKVVTSICTNSILHFVEKITNEDFKAACKKSIDNACPILSTHRGLKKILVNLAYAVAGLFVIYGIARAIEYSRSGNFFIPVKTNSEELLDEVKASLCKCN